MKLPHECLNVFFVLALAFKVVVALDTKLTPVLDKDSSWIEIESEQTITTSSGLLGQGSKWLVTEYVTFERQLAYSIYLNTQTRQSYELLSSQSGKFYVKVDEASRRECEHDHRHDYSTLFPWSHWSKSMRLTGVAGLWLNLVDQKKACSSSASSLHCGGVQGGTEFRIDFDPSSQLPTEAEYVGRNVIWTDQATLLDWVKHVVKIKKFRRRVPVEILQTLESRKKLCHSSDELPRNSVPSLMKLLTKSESRAYKINYVIVVPDANADEREIKSATWHEVEEWFSYGHGMQTFMRNINHGRVDRSQKYGEEIRQKLMQLFNVEDGTGLGYEIQFEGFKRERSCKFASLADDLFLGKISRLMKWRIKLAPSKSTTSANPNTGYLVGLGALLMNMANMERKGKVRTIHSFSENENQENFSFVREIQDSEQTIRFEFEGGAEIAHLRRVEILNGIAETRRLVAYIDSIDFKTDIRFASKLEHPFEVPAVCPPVGEFVQPAATERSTEQETRREVEPSMAHYDFSFPSSESWHAYLKENYKLSSVWSIRRTKDGSAQFDVVEYLMRDGDKLLARIDMIEGEKIVKFVLNYDKDVQYRIQDDHCELVEELDPRLEVVSVAMNLAGYHQTNRDKPMRYFGLGGLWSLASRSASLDLTDLTKSDIEPNQFIATWLLHNDPELSESTSAKFSFLTKPDRELENLDSGDREATSSLKSVKIQSTQFEFSISISNPRVESNKATPSDFEIPLICPPTIRARQRQFPSILDELIRADSSIEPSTRLSKIDFELKYDLLWTSEGKTFLVQVTELNLPQKQVRVCSMDFVDDKTLGQTKVSFWTRAGNSPESLLEYQYRGGSRVCSRAPRLEHLMGMNLHLHTIKGSNRDDGGEFTGLPLTDLWTALSNDLGRHPRLYHAVSKTTDDDKVHTIWSLNYDAGIGLFELETRPDEKQLEHLKSVAIEKALDDGQSSEKIFMSFQLKNVGRVQNLDQMSATLKVPSGCKHVGQLLAGDFPSLSNHLRRGERFWMRSEIASGDMVSSSHEVSNHLSEAHFLEEWLAFNEAYRSRYSTGTTRLGEGPKKTDQLIYPRTREHFDLTEANNCKTSCMRVGECGASSNRTSGNFISESLFHSEHNLSFYGPISLWLLSEEAKFRRLLFDGEPAREGLASPDHDYKLRFFDLFDDGNFRDWLQTDRWLVSHEHFGKFVMIFKPQDSGKQATRLDRVQQVAGEYPTDIQVINYSFDTDPDHFKEILRIPAGFGCVRSPEARELAKQRPKDHIVFDKTVPFEFYYEASLKLAADSDQAGRLLSLPVFNTGRMMTCPERWTTMFAGSLRVNLHESHHLSGRTSATRRVVMRDLHSSSRATVRLIDELAGSCQIDIDRSDPFAEAKIIELNFSGEIVTFTMSQLLDYFQSMENFERIQDYESVRRGTEKTTTVVLEAKSDSLRLNDNLAGRGSIVRTFTRDAESRSAETRIYHDAAKLELIIYAKAHLTFHVSKMKFMECAEIISEAKSDECFLDRQATSSEKVRRRRRKFEMIFEPVEFVPGKLDFDNLLKPQVTFREFLQNRQHLEREFQSTFFAAPDRIPVAQLGRFDLKYSADHSKLVASFSLLEPVSLLHEFEQLFGHAIDFEAARQLEKVGVELERRPASSMFRCADLCESRPHSCLAFSHCSDRTCTFLQVHDKQKLEDSNLDRHVESLLEPFLKTNSACSLFYHWISLDRQLERIYIDEIVALIRGQIAKSEEENKFTLTSRITTSKRAVRTKFKAVDLNEIIKQVDGKGNEVEPDTSEERLAKEYVVLADRSELDPTGIGADKPAVKTMMFEAQNLENCLDACSLFECRLASFCSISRVCLLVANLTRWAQFESVSTSCRPDREHCAVFVWDFTRHFELFDETREPNEFAWRQTLATPTECAARCQLDPDCLSFDFCLEQSQGSPAATCFGQRSHVSFNRLLLSTTTDNKPVQAELSSRRCSHYSKFLLADFEAIERTKFADHKSILFHDMGLDQCAAVCRRDASCRSFEYCTKPSKRDNTCYIEERHLKNPISNSTLDSRFVETIRLDDCSIYRLKTRAQEIEVIQEKVGARHSIQEDEHHESVHIHPTAWFCLISISLGFLIGFVIGKFVQSDGLAEANS